MLNTKEILEYERIISELKIRIKELELELLKAKSKDSNKYPSDNIKVTKEYESLMMLP